MILCYFHQDHVEGYLELSGKTKTYFSTAVSKWDAEFYVKVDDDVHVNIGKLNNLPTFNFYFPVCMLLTSIMWSIVLLKISAATLGETLVRHRKKHRVYIGCMKSGPVLSQKYNPISLTYLLLESLSQFCFNSQFIY